MPTASFPRCKSREITASFDGGEITSDGGALLLRQLDREMGLTRTIARRLDDPRLSRRCRHRAETMLRQRIFGLALGYEDLNDHHALRRDIALQTAVDTDGVLASQSTLCRFEQQASRQWAVAIQEEIVEQFIRSFRRLPKKRLILDFDATDDPMHGEKLGQHFSGFYNGYCFLPLYVFYGQGLLVSYLRQVWSEVKIFFRGDSGFCRSLILAWRERHGVE